ncbi:MAG TPA: PmoA family protein [Natronosporangium sp.]|nr:PmoA family protein [Natronosporangium sp.]
MDAVSLWLAGRNVVDYILAPDLHPTLAPRPYLHPVRTLAGLPVTDALPADHRWHLGASLALPDVSGTNLWGGRTYVRGTGYAWRDDHGRIEHVEFTERGDDRLAHRLRWRDRDGGLLLDEHRRLAARLLPGRSDAWVLDVAYTLTAPDDRQIVLASPATNGRPGGAGYGGFFWRAARAARPPRVFTATSAREATVNGSTEPWVGLVSPAPYPYTLVFTGLGEGWRWFVRSSAYTGVCAAPAFDAPRVIPPGGSLHGRHAVVVVDAVLSRRVAGQLAAMVAPGADPRQGGGRDLPAV